MKPGLKTFVAVFVVLLIFASSHAISKGKDCHSLMHITTSCKLGVIPNTSIKKAYGYPFIYKPVNFERFKNLSSGGEVLAYNEVRGISKALFTVKNGTYYKLETNTSFCCFSVARQGRNVVVWAIVNPNIYVLSTTAGTFLGLMVYLFFNSAPVRRRRV